MFQSNEHEVECSFYPDAFQTDSPLLTTLRQYIGYVKSGKYQDSISLFRAYVASGEKDKAVQCKKHLPLLVPCCIMKGGRKKEHIASYTACMVADLDHVPGSPEEVLRQAEALPYVKAGHVSPSGTGDKLFIMVDSDFAHHPEAFELVRRRVEADLPGVTVDISGKDPNRGCFISSDPEAFYKEEAEVLRVPVAPVKEKGRYMQPAAGQKRSEEALSNYIDKFESSNAFAPGGRHSYVLKLASALNSAGFDEHEVIAECLRRYTQPDFQEKEIGDVVADVYRRYRNSHGSNPWCPTNVSADKKSVKSIKNSTPIPPYTPVDEDSDMGFDIEPEEAGLPHFDRALLSHLPTLVADAVKKTSSDIEHDLMLLATLTACSTVLPGVKGMLKLEEYAPTLFGIVIGPSGSGKGCVIQVHKMVLPFQKYVFDNSRHEVLEYEKKKEAAELYKVQQRQGRGKSAPGLPPETPDLVRQKQLHISGYTSTARMIELLEINAPYASFLFETELESVSNTMAQDFGGYGYVLNQAFHHEVISSSSKGNGSAYVERPVMGFFATGTPGVFLRLIPSTENGLYSRMLIYRIAGEAPYQDLTSGDSTFSNSRYYDNLGQRLLDIAIHLEKNPTFISFTDKQRKKLDRYFKREYNNVRVFGNDDITSVVLRHRLIIFRMAMVLTALRKGESRSTEANVEISDDDFEAAFHIGICCLRHSMLVSTTMKRSDSNLRHKLPSAQQNLFADLPVKFKTAEALDLAGVRGVSRSAVFRMLKKAQSYKLVNSLGGGWYQKTDEGKKVTNSGMG